MVVAKTQAYFNMATITAVKSFVVQASRERFFTSHYNPVARLGASP
jgi:hypothetical protein